MPVIQCDIRNGWTDEQKAELARRITAVVSEVGDVSVEKVHIVIREARGLHYMFGGKQVPEFEASPDD